MDDGAEAADSRRETAFVLCVARQPARRRDRLVMQRPAPSSRLVSCGLAAVLIVLTTFAMWAAFTTQEAAGRARSAASLSDQYQQARYWVGAEESAERAYRISPGPPAYAEHRAAARALLSALQTIRRAGAADDRALVDQALRAHARYLIAVTRLFAVANQGNLPRGVRLDRAEADPLFSRIETLVDGAAEARRAEALRRLADLERMQRIVVVATPVVFALGLLLLGLCAYLLSGYKRRIDEATQARLAQLGHAALTDHLTELGNHRAYQEDFYRETSRALRHGEPLALALIDVDEFKAINGQNGHVHGDLVLTAVATLLASGRVEDRAYRLGGDEFALLLPHGTVESAMVVLERLRRDVQRNLCTTTVSIGLALLTPGETDVATLQEQAAAALYEAKRRGRNTVVTFEEIRESASILSSAKAQALRRVLIDGHVGVVFQPIWDVARGEILAFEALARPAAHYGFEGPQEAFDIAERIGRAHDLDAVCRNAILDRAGELPPDALLFLNLSPQTLDLDVLAGTALVDAVRAAGLRPERVVLELTERSMARLAVVVREATRLRGLGFKLALDDTGAGNAGLEMLSQLPVDFVKIDRAVVVKALSDRAARAVLAGIIAIARETDTYVIAEGIEDTAMLNLARQAGVPNGAALMGVQGVQGYLLGRPSETILAPAAADRYRTRISAA